MIAVDIGNSQLHFKAPTGSAAVPWDRLAAEPHGTGWHGTKRHGAELHGAERLWEALQQSPLAPLLRETPPETACDWWISSVNPPATAALRQALATQRPLDRCHEIRSVDVPLGDRLQNRAATGVDRLLVAWYASRFFEPTATGSLVVDAGSAVTVDWVDAAGDFRGGMIYPGFALSGRSLQRGTAALPPVTAIDLQAPLPLPAGTSTQAAIEAGLFWSQWGGMCSAIEALQKFAQRTTQAEQPATGASPLGLTWLEPPQVILTGGGIAAFQSLLPPHWRWEPDLLLRAILEWADRHISATSTVSPAAAVSAGNPASGGEDHR